MAIGVARLGTTFAERAHVARGERWHIARPMSKVTTWTFRVVRVARHTGTITRVGQTACQP